MQSFKPVKLSAPSKRTQHCWELLHPFVRSVRTDRIKAMSRSFTEGKKSRSSLFILENRKTKNVLLPRPIFGLGRDREA